MKVAILTTQHNLDPAYSLTGVTLEIRQILEENHVPVDLFVTENFKDDRVTCVVRAEVPTGKLVEDQINDELKQRVEAFLDKILPEYDVVITQDLMFQSWFVTYNAAIRNRIEDHPNVTWVHWVHSAPGGRPNRLLGAASLRYEVAPYSLYVYLNHADVRLYAESIGTDIGRIAVVHNPMDAASFLGCDEKTSGFIRKNRLWDHDLMQVYPFSTPRAPDKGIDKVVGIFGAWKQQGHKVKLVLVNAHANQQAEKKDVQTMKEMAREDWGLVDGVDICFTSDEEDWDYAVPNETVRQLFQLSNVFVFPTTSENCSRVLQEASLAGCLVVGNASFPPMSEFLTPGIQSYDFGSLRNRVDYHSGIRQYLREVARSLTPLLSHPAMKQKTHMLRLAARETVWREQIQPLLERAASMSKSRAAEVV